MELYLHRCKTCGGELVQIDDTWWKCVNCKNIYHDKDAQAETKKMRELFDDAKLETINNLRRNLYDAITADYISSTDVRNACTEIKKHLPDDFSACFYDVAVGKNIKALNRAIRAIDVEEHYQDVENIIKFLIKSLEPSFLLELSDLIERAYKNRDLKLFEDYATMLSEEAEKVQDGVYLRELSRDVFVAYSSKDMKYVSELVELLEGQGLKCFVAARNLRQGRGAYENYEKALEEAMDNCKCFVFVSTMNSRSLSCDALTIEIPYVKKQDIENAPEQYRSAQYRNNYNAIPDTYKKSRVHYMVEQSRGYNVADRIVEEFFGDHQWAFSAEEVADRVVKQLTEMPVEEHEEHETAKKYCANCGTEAEIGENFCSKCGKNQFVDDIGEYIKLQNRKEIEERRRREEEERRRREEEKRRNHSQNIYSSTSAYAPAQKGKSKTVAILLALFMGFLGADMFYLGYKKRGVGRIFGFWGSFIAGMAITVSTGSEAVVWMYVVCGVLMICAALSSYVDAFRIAIGALPLDPKEYYAMKAQKKKKGKAAFWIFFFIVIITVFIIAMVNSEDIDPNDPMHLTPIYEESVAVGGDKQDEVLRRGSWGSVNYVISVDGTLTISGEGDIPAYEDTKEQEWKYGYTDIRSIVVEDGVVSIGAFAFSDLYSLKEVTLASSVIEIGDSAFANSSLKSIDAPGVIDIGNSAFANASNLQSVKFNDNIRSIGEYAFDGTSIMNSLSLSAPVIVEDWLLTVSQEEAGQFTVPAEVKKIGELAMAYCSQVDAVIISIGLEKICDYAFFGMSSLDSIIYLGTQEQWDAIEKEANWNAIDEYNDRIEKIVFLNGDFSADDIGKELDGMQFELREDGSFRLSAYTGSETNVIIPDNYLGIAVREIGEAAFAYTNIVSVELPASITTIAYQAFINCEKLETVTVADGIDLREVDANAFSGTALMASVTADNPLYLGNCLVKVSQDTKGTFIIKKGTVAIADEAFNYCTSIKAVQIPTSVLCIGNSCFSVTDYLASIYYYGTEEQWNNIEKGTSWDYGMGSWTTEGCYIYFLNGNYDPDNAEPYTSGLRFTLNSDTNTYMVTGYSGSDTEVVIPNTYFGISVTAIDTSAFSGSAITSVSIPASIQRIESSAFYACSALTDVKLAEDNSLEHISSDAFRDSAFINAVSSDAPIYLGDWLVKVSTGSVGAFEIPSGIKHIADGAMQSCREIDRLIVPASVENIGANAFYQMENLNELIFLGTVDDWGNVEKGESYSYNAGVSTSAGTYYLRAIEGQYTHGDVFSLPEGMTVEYIQSSNSYCVRDYEGTETDIVIPSTYLGLDVTEIGTYAFSSSGIHSIEIPSSISLIGEYAFNSCFSLSSVTFGADIQLNEISKHTFDSCTSIASITIPKSVTSIKSAAFSNCNSLADLSFEEGSQLVSIGSDAFNDIAVTSLSLPTTLESIGERAFNGCENITELILDGHGSLKSIGSSAFSYCTLLAKVKLPSGISNVSSDVFSYCDVTDATVPISCISCFEPSVLKSLTINGGTALSGNRMQNSNIETLVIGDSVTSIAGGYFYGCEGLKSVVLGSGITSIQNEAFSSCSSLESIVFNCVPETWGSDVFKFCSALKSVVLPEEMTSLPVGMFRSCTALESVALPSSLESIGQECFEGCGALAAIELPESLKTVGINAFSNSGLTKIVIPSGVTALGQRSFGSCKKLESVKVMGSGTSIDTYAFNSSNAIKDVTAPMSAIGCFEKGSLETVVITSGSSIARNTFVDCTALKSITLPEGLELIGDSAFANCVSLMSIEIPSSLQGCATNAFSGCIRLVEVIDHSIQNVAQYIPEHLVTNETSGIEIIDDYAFISVGEVNYLLGHVGSESELTLPADYNGAAYMIFKNAFVGKTKITALTIPNANITPDELGDHIPSRAFEGCTGILSVSLPDGTEPFCIGSSAFYGCTSLADLKIGSRVSVIKSFAFASCSALTRVEIPKSVTEIHNEVFSYCSSLDMVIFTGRTTFNVKEGINSETFEVLNVVNAGENAKNMTETVYMYRIWVAPTE